MALPENFPIYFCYVLFMHLNYDDLIQNWFHLTGLCGNKKRAGNMVCSACCGDAVCNGDSCEDILGKAKI